MVPSPPENDQPVGAPAPAPTYREPDLAKLQEAFRRQVSGAQRVVEAFDKAKEVSQTALDYEVSL